MAGFVRDGFGCNPEQTDMNFHRPGLWSFLNESLPPQFVHPELQIFDHTFRNLSETAVCS